MSKSKNKLIRYRNLLKKITNWKIYLLMKIIGFKKTFTFKIKDFGEVKIDKNMMGPFRENFLDDIYFRYIPNEVFENNPHPLVIDIGANVGFFSLATFSKFPKSKIYSFEPHPYCYKVILEYQKKFKHYTWLLSQRAVCDQDTEIKLNTSTVSGFTTMASTFNSEVKQEEFLAKTIKLDSFISENNIPNINFIKIDCEGSEYSIIYTLPKESFDKIDSLCIETHKGKEKNQNINSLNSYLSQMKYTTKVLDEGNIGYIWAWKFKYNTKKKMT